MEGTLLWIRPHDDSRLSSQRCPVAHVGSGHRSITETRKQIMPVFFTRGGGRFM